MLGGAIDYRRITPAGQQIPLPGQIFSAPPPRRTIRPNDLYHIGMWDIDDDPKGYWITEHIRGLRALWNGQNMLDNTGKQLSIPTWFTADLPANKQLDGQLYAGRARYDHLQRIVVKGNPGHPVDDWRDVSYEVFDLVDNSHAPKGFEDRYEELRSLESISSLSWINVVDYEKCQSAKHLTTRYNEVRNLSGEGLILQKPGTENEGPDGDISRKTFRREISKTYKCVPLTEFEAVVIGHLAAKTKREAGCGGLRCKLHNSTRNAVFLVERGLTDDMRQNPPQIVSTTSYFPRHSNAL